MVLQSLNLTNFRNYPSTSFTFSPTTTLILGPNAAGKTNILEAVYYLASGKSFRAGYDRESIRCGEAVSHLRGGIDYGDGILELELQVLANENGENTSSKRFKVNGVKKRRADFSGILRAVYFGPEQIQLVTGSPSRRRKYLDSVLVQADRDYARALSEYEKVVRQRNRLLLLVREGDLPAGRQVNRDQLGFWDEKLVALGAILSKKRQEMFETINNQLSIDSKNRRLDRTISGLFLEYQPKVVNREVLERGQKREIAAGMTLWGPHRDDFKFKVQSSKFKVEDGRDLSSFGSRGEQRLAVLHLKLAELEFITERAGERPLLLLDDIFSELDEDNRGHVLELLGKQQTIITATDLDQIDGEKLVGHTVLQLQI